MARTLARLPPVEVSRQPMGSSQIQIGTATTIDHDDFIAVFAQQFSSTASACTHDRRLTAHSQTGAAVGGTDVLAMVCFCAAGRRRRLSN